MKILWLNWKDRKNPNAGGAEVVNEELAKRLVRDRHEVIFLTAEFPGAAREEMIDGFKVIRLGNRWSVYWQAYKYYKKNLQGWSDLVIDEVNTIPFFAKFYVKEKNIVICYQLCREIWFYEMFFPLNLIGFLLEPVYLWFLRDRVVLTESESTKSDLQNYGHKKENIFVFPVGLEAAPITKIELANQEKEKNPTILYFGSIRGMKRPDHVLKAFEIAKEKIANLKLFVAGSGNTAYSKKFIEAIGNSKFNRDITYFGRVNNDKKKELMEKVQVIAVTSVKEGWGLIVTEANSRGTPAIVYDADGLRDACKNDRTGIVCKPEPQTLANNIIKMFEDRELYEKYRRNAWEDSFNYNYQRSYEIFIGYINNLNIKNKKI